MAHLEAAQAAGMQLDLSLDDMIKLQQQQKRKQQPQAQPQAQQQRQPQPQQQQRAYGQGPSFRQGAGDRPNRGGGAGGGPMRGRFQADEPRGFGPNQWGARAGPGGGSAGRDRFPPAGGPGGGAGGPIRGPPGRWPAGGGGPGPREEFYPPQGRLGPGPRRGGSGGGQGGYGGWQDDRFDQPPPPQRRGGDGGFGSGWQGDGQFGGSAGGRGGHGPRRGGPPNRGGGGGGRSGGYREHQRCYRNDDTGEVVVKFHLTDIIRVTPSGDVILDSGGYLTQTTFDSFNDALAVLGIKLTHKGDVTLGDWTVSDGRSLVRFQDGLVIPHKGQFTSNRGALLLEGYAHPGGWAGAAAEAAEPQHMGGWMAPMASLMPGAGRPHAGGAGGGYRRQAGPKRGADEMEVDGAESEHARRLKRQGRYAPY